MAVTEESVQEKRERLGKLREQAQAEALKRQESQDKAQLLLTDAQLDAQIKEAEAVLEREKHLSSLAAAKASVAPAVEAAKEDKQVAAQVLKAEEKEGK